MPIVKRYPNRKLYNTETKQYITLDGIAALIRQGEDVQIVDHATGEDLTALTLSQIIFEQEKKQGGFLPHPVLTGLVRAGGETLGTLRRNLVSPLGLLRHIDDEIERRINSLIGSGELAEEEGRRLLEKLVDQGRRLRDGPQISDADIERILSERGVPSRDDLQRVIAQLDALAAKLDEMNGNPEQA